MEAIYRLQFVTMTLLFLFGRSRGKVSDGLVHIGLMIHSEKEDAEGLKDAFEYKMKKLNYDRVTFESADRQNITDMDKITDVINNGCSILSKGVVAFVVVGTTTSNEVFSSIAQQMNIPVFMPLESYLTSCKKSDFVMTLTPSYISAIVDLITFFKWMKIYYLFDSNEGLLRLQELYQLTSDLSKKHNEFTIRPRKINNISDYYDLLLSIDKMDENCSCPISCLCPKYIILDLSSVHAFNLTREQIINVGMNRDGYHYVLSNLGIDDLDLRAFEYGGVNITGFSIVDMKHKQRILKDNECGLYSKLCPITHEKALLMDTLEFISKSVKEFRRSYKKITNLRNPASLDCSNSSNYWLYGESFRRVIQDVRVEKGFTGTVTLDKNGSRSNYLLEIHQMNYKQPLKKIGTWSTGETLSTRLQTNLSANVSRNVDVRNKTWVIVTIEGEPFVQRLKSADNEMEHTGIVTINDQKYEGYCIDMAELVKKRYEKEFKEPFNYKFKLVDDGQFGDRDEDNGSWNGMIGELLHEKADLALASLTITEERQRVVDFTKPFMKIGISIMIKRPDKQKPGVFSFMQPLSKYVWICILVVFLAVSFVLYFVGRWSPYEWQTSPEEQSASNAFTLSNTLWFALGALMQQGSDIFPRSISGRVVGSAWWFFTLILISSYTANLAAFLTIEHLLTSINSVDDLASQTTIEYGVYRNGATEAFFERTQIPVYQKMRKFMEANDERVKVTSDIAGIQKVRNSKGKYAYLLESPKNNYYNQKKPCNTMKVGDNLDHKGYGIATPTDSPIRSQLNIIVLKLREEGKLHKLEQKWWYDKGECGAVDSKDTTKSPLTLSNVSGIFHILIGGLVLAMVVSLLEFIFNRLRKQRRKTLREKTALKSRSTVKIEKKNPLEVLKAAGYSENENNAYTFNPPDQLTTFESGGQTQI